MTDFMTVGTVLESIWALAMKIAHALNPTMRPDLLMRGNDVPTVDIFVVCCKEPDEVIMDTVKAACQIDWPASRFRVILADDGKSAGLRQDVAQLRAKHPNLHYYSRPKRAGGVPSGNKAGNLNDTLRQYVEKTAERAGEYLAVFDADMMPQPEILRKLVPHAVKDRKMAMVTAAQVGGPEVYDAVPC